MRIRNLGLYLLLTLMLLTPFPAGGPVDEPRGGASPFFCILLGVTAGLSFSTGNAIGVLGSLGAAHRYGCF